MRVLLFSDLHGHGFKPHSKVLPDGTNSRLQDAVNILQQICDLTKAEDVDLVLCAGDLFHSPSTTGNIPIRVFNKIFGMIAKISLGKRQVGLLVGNHDQTTKDGDVHSIYAFGSLATVMDKPGWQTFSVKGQNIHVYSLPYHSDKDHLLDALRHSGSTPNRLEPTCFLGHFGIDGAKVGGNFVLVDKHCVKLSQLEAREYDQVFLGHYHEPQKLSANVRYLGATHQHNWGDKGSERGCWLWDTGENDPYSEPTFRPLNAPRFVHHEEGDSWENGRGNFVRVICDNELDSKVKEIVTTELENCAARYVEFVVEAGPDQESSQQEFDPTMDYKEMVDAYVDNVADVDVKLDEDYLKEIGQEIIQSVM